MTTDSLDRPILIRRGKVLEYATVGYNCLEGVIAIGAGLLAGSIALVGFGFDSVIEVISGVTLLWRLYSDVDEQRRERVEGRALRIVGISFFLLAAYIAYDAGKALIRREPPQESTVGIVLAAVSLIVMPLLVRANDHVADAVEVPGLGNVLGARKMNVIARDIRHGKAEMQPVRRRIAHERRGDAVERAHFVVMRPRDLPDVRVARSDARLVLVDGLERQIESEAALAGKVQHVRVERARGRAAAR